MNQPSQPRRPPSAPPSPVGQGGSVVAPERKSGSWLQAGLVAIGAAVAVTVLGFIALLIGASVLYPTSDWEGEGGALAVILLFLFSASTFGPASFFTALMISSRRNPNLGRRGLPFIGALCFVPIMLASLVALHEFADPRNMGWAAWIALGCLAVALISWLVASIDKVSLRLASTASFGALAAIVLTVAAASWNAHNFRRSERLAALQSDELSLYLPESSSTDWQIDRMYLFDPVARQGPGRIVADAASAGGATARLLTDRTRSNPICTFLADNGKPCRPLLTTPRGRAIANENFGEFFYEVTYDGEYVAIGSPQELSERELVSLVDTLERQSPESWLDRYEDFDSDR